MDAKTRQPSPWPQDTKRGFERRLSAQRLNGHIDAPAIGDAHALVHGIDLREVDDVVRPEPPRDSRSATRSTAMMSSRRSRAPTVAQRPIGPWAKTATASPMRTLPRSAPLKPVDMMSGHISTCSSVSPSGMGARLAIASGTRTYSAWQPSMVLPNFHPPPSASSRVSCRHHPASSSRRGRRCSSRSE
jgi:hypothetical protein